MMDMQLIQPPANHDELGRQIQADQDAQAALCMTNAVNEARIVCRTTPPVETHSVFVYGPHWDRCGK